MSSKNSDLKNRLKALRVNEPLRLSKNGPEFKAPEQPSSGKEVPQSPAPQSENSQGEAAPNKDSRNEAPRKELAQNGRSRPEIPQSEEPQNGCSPTGAAGVDAPGVKCATAEAPRTEQTGDGHARNEVARNEHIKIEIAQIEAPHDEDTRPERARNETAKYEESHRVVPRNGKPQNELSQNDQDDRFEEPQSEQTQFELPHAGGSHGTGERADWIIPKERVDSIPESQDALYGYFKLAHTVFLEPLLRKVSGDCFRLFLWLSSRAWRYHDSQGVVRASVRFIEQQAGIPHATISRSLKTLRDIGLVSLLETDYKHGNVWRVSPVAFGNRGPDIKPPRLERPQSERSKGGEAASKRASSSLDLRTELPQDERNIRNSRTSRTLSLGVENAQTLWAEIEQTRPAEKRKSETACLEQLLGNYDAEDLTLALTFLKRNGILGSGDRCHSPFRYLATAAEDVIKAARKSASLATVHPLHGKSSSETGTGEKDAAEDREARAKALCTFQAEVAEEERKRFIADYVQSEYPHGFLPPETIVTTLAAMRWFTGRSQAAASNAASL